MAPPAAERGWLALGHLLAPAPGRLGNAARLALICALTAVVTAAYRTPDMALAAYCPFFYFGPDRMGTAVRSVVMMLVVALMIALLFPIANLVVDHPAWRVAAMALIAMLVLFLFPASKLAPLTGVVALVMAYALDLLGSVQSGEIAARGLLYVLLICFIPCVITIIVGLLLAPAPRRLLEGELAARLRAAAAALRHPGPRTLGDVERLLRQGEAQVDARLHLVRMERSTTPEDLATLSEQAQAVVAVLSAVQMAARSPQAALPQPLRETLAQAMDSTAQALAKGGLAVATAAPAPIEQRLAEPAAVARSTIEAALARLAHAPVAAAPEPPKESSGLLAADAFSNPDYLRFALKTTAAAMFCYLAYSLLAWPGIHTAMITCFIVSLPTLADGVEKLALRITGCLLGAALGTAAMVYVVPHFTSVGALFFIVFAGAFAGAWLVMGSPRIAYAGFQLAFAFFLCILQDTGPSFDLVTARDRIIGILLGNFVAYFVGTQLWPVSVARRIDTRIAAAVQRLVQMASAADAGTRVRLASQAHATLGAVIDDLQLVRYEPASVRPSPRWVLGRRLRVARAGAIAGPLLVAAEGGGPAAARAAQRLQALQSAVAAVHEPEKAAHVPL
jgi:multidrug resistance protein MdtO